MKQKVDKLSTNVGAVTFCQLAFKSTTDEMAYLKQVKETFTMNVAILLLIAKLALEVDKMSTNVGAMTFGQLAFKSTTDEMAYLKQVKEIFTMNVCLPSKL
jgi:hypothetical protein